jgi:hypothetical protein
MIYKAASNIYLRSITILPHINTCKNIITIPATMSKNEGVIVKDAAKPWHTAYPVPSNDFGIVSRGTLLSWMQQ